MKNQEKDIDLITRFFDLALSDQELIDFEIRLAKDDAFKQEVQAYREADFLVNETYQTSTEQVRTQKWKNLLDTDKNIKPLKNIPWKWIYSIAAGFILVFSIRQLNTTYQKPNMSQLIGDSWNKKIGLDFSVNRGAKKDSLKQKISLAYDAYNDKNYQTTINVLNDYKTSMTYYEDVLLLKGLSNYKKGNVDIALKMLDTLANYPTGKNSKVAQWYQGLIFLEQGNVQAAKEFLQLPENNTQEIKLKE